MRRISIMLLILIVALGIVACSKPAEPQGGDNSNSINVTLKAKIIDINEASLLVANMAKDASPSDIYMINIGNTKIKAADERDAAITDLRTGMLIDIVFDGTIMESFPM